MSHQDNKDVGFANSGKGNSPFLNTESRTPGATNSYPTMNTPIPNPVGSPAVQRGDIPEMYLDAPAAAIQSDKPGNIIFEDSFSMSQSSVGASTMEPYTASFTVPAGGAVAAVSLEVDDWGKMVISGPGGPYVLDLTAEAASDSGPYGGHTLWGKEDTFDLPPGNYSVTVTQSNIDMPYNDYNVSSCSFSITVTAKTPPPPDSSSSSLSSYSSSSSLPTDSSSSSSSSSSFEKEVPICKDCSCKDNDGDETDDPSEDPPEDTEEECPASTTTDEDDDDTEENPSPRTISLLNARTVASSRSASFGMKYETVWEWQARIQEGVITIIPTSGQALYFNMQEGSSEAIPAGITRKRDFRVQLQNADLTPCTSGSLAILMLTDSSGRRIRFSVETGKVVSVTSSSGKVTTAEARAQNVKTVFDEKGHMTACFSTTKGLMLVENGENGSKLISWFPSDKVTQNADGSFSTQGEPYKTATYSISYANGVRTTTVVRQQRGLPPHTITRTVDGNRVTITKGEGDDMIIRTYESNTLFDNMRETIVTVRGINDAEPLSCTREVKKLTDGGWLTVSRTEAFNTPLARTTTYEYNEQYHLSLVNRPDGGYTEYEYDSQNRVTVETEPWADDGVKRTRYVYAASSDRFYDTRPVKVYTDYQQRGGSFLNLKVVDYFYEDTPQVERTMTKTYAAGLNYQQVTIDETYGEAAAYPYAAGKAKFSQAVNGVQTLHTYEATAEHDAIHLHTSITQANDALVAGQSRKTEEFIAANDTVTFSQESIWDGHEWLLLSTAVYEYDEQLRLVKTTRGNGRTSATEWMCCGRLRETDEDGVLTTHAYNTALQHLGTTRSAVMDGETLITPETLSEITPDALGRAVTTRREIGPMITEEHTEYDLLGRVVKQTDALGRVTTTEYSEDGLTTTVTIPTGATLITTRNVDGSTASISGTGQRELHYAYDINSNRLRTTVRTAAGEILSQTLTDGYGQTVVQTAPSTIGYIYTRSEYNAMGQLVKQYQDTGAGTASNAPTLYEYDAMGNQVKQTLVLSDPPTKYNSYVQEIAYSVEQLEDGVYSVTTSTRYNVHGEALMSTQKQLVSALSAMLESKVIAINERGNTSSSWIEYAGDSKRINYSIVPTSEITAKSHSVDGFTISQMDHQGITVSYTRHYSKGITQTQTDGRGNTTTTVTDIVGRTIRVIDAAGNKTTTDYYADSDLPAKVTDALGNTTCYAYDVRGRKIAEWGTAIQPACFGYDEANRMTSLTTFRVGSETISSDPSNRTDGDTTTWEYHDATGLEIRKTYADGSQVMKSYDAFNRLETETDARGVVKTHTYDSARGLLLRTSYSDGTTPREFAYNHLGQLTQITDDAGTRALSYNAYGEVAADSLLADGVTHTITEQRDEFGRSVGYIYAKDGVAQQTVTTGYASDGRIASAGFMHGGVLRNFTYGYLPGSNLMEKLVMPNNMTLTQSYEAQRDLLIGMEYRRGDALVTQRSYIYDALGRPTKRDTQYPLKDIAHSDSFVHNSRSELVHAQLDDTMYGYDYDNIGNRRMAVEGNESSIYEANELNQYTSIIDGADTFEPQFDLAGNQTLVKTSTGTWHISYNAENRPVRFESEDGNIVVECAYDYMGRRSYKKVTTNGVVTLHQCYIYRGYLQIAACDLTRTSSPCLWLILWDPTQPMATRSLVIQKDGVWYVYGWDLTKNICELYGQTGYIRTIYTYTPYGAVTADGDVEQPIQWSSEFLDTELGLMYYNWRSYEPRHGVWISLDVYYSKPYNMYMYTANNPLYVIDVVGHYPVPADTSVVAFAPPYNYENKQVVKTQEGEKTITIYGETEVHPKYTWEDLYTINYCGSTVEITHANPRIMQGIFINIYFYLDKHRKENDPNSGYRDRQNRTVREHEMGHANIEIEEWNNFIAAADAQLGCYESIDEYKKKHEKTIADLFIEYRQKVDERHTKYDRDAGSIRI